MIALAGKSKTVSEVKAHLETALKQIDKAAMRISKMEERIKWQVSE